MKHKKVVVMPAEAGIQLGTIRRLRTSWIPAFAGMTALALSLIAVPVQSAGAPYAYESIPGASPEPLPGSTGPKSREELETFLDGVMAAHLKYNPLAGATISVVKDGAVLLVKGYGRADIEKNTPVDGATTLFRPGSTSKLFTWTAVMQLVEQGKLDLDADVNTYLTDFKIPDAFGKPITLRNLMTHTPGLEDGGIGYLLAKDVDHLMPLGEALAKHMPGRVRPPTTDFGSDGSNASYSNWGTALAGHIIATVSGMPFDDYVQKNIFAPLGMSSSTFAEPLPAALAPHMATGYTLKQGKLKAHDFELVHSFGPAGSLTSSAPDMARFMLAHLNDGELDGQRILKPETAQLMHSRLFAPGGPHINGSGLGFYESWINGRRVIGHGGDLVAFHADLWLLPDEKTGIFVAYNSSNELAPYIVRRDLIQSYMDRYYPAKLPQLKAPEDFKTRAARYAGSYEANRHSFTKFEKVFGLLGAGTQVAPTEDNKLMISNLLLPGVSYWVEVAPSVFREEDGAEMIAFIEDGQGKVTHLVNSFPFIGAAKLEWCQSHQLHWFILGFGLLCFVVAIVSALRHWKADRAAPAAARRARRLAALLGAVQISGVVMLVAIVASDIDALIVQIPRSIYAALTFPILAIPLTLLVLWAAIGVWKDSGWSRYARFQYTVIALSGAAFLWSQYVWNLIGYKLG